jgi:hypothetical protein
MYISFWNQETEEKLVQLVYDDLQWDEVSEKMGASISNCKTKYMELCPLDQRLKHQLTKLDDMIDSFMVEKQQVCEICTQYQFNGLHEWKGKQECDTCYQHEDEIRHLWLQVRLFSIKQGMTHCSFCNKEHTVNTSFHYDHMNMFNKLDNVSSLVYKGEPIDIILHEIKKCQLLCVSCHALVTKVEQRLGFTGIKISMKREFQGEAYDTKMKEYEELYKQHMTIVYDKISKKLS